MGTLCFWAMYPRKEKTTKPEEKLVRELMEVVRIASLQDKTDVLVLWARPPWPPPSLALRSPRLGLGGSPGPDFLDMHRWLPLCNCLGPCGLRVGWSLSIRVGLSAQMCMMGILGNTDSPQRAPRAEIKSHAHLGCKDPSQAKKPEGQQQGRPWSAGPSGCHCPPSSPDGHLLLRGCTRHPESGRPTWTQTGLEQGDLGPGPAVLLLGTWRSCLAILLRAVFIFSAFLSPGCESKHKPIKVKESRPQI